MKVKDGFVLRSVVGEWMLMPTGDNFGTFHGTLVMNELSAFIWEKLRTPTTRDALLKDILAEYEVDENTAGRDLDALLAELKSIDLIEE